MVLGEEVTQEADLQDMGIARRSVDHAGKMLQSWYERAANYSAMHMTVRMYRRDTNDSTEWLEMGWCMESPWPPVADPRTGANATCMLALAESADVPAVQTDKDVAELGRGVSERDSWGRDLRGLPHEGVAEGLPIDLDTPPA